MLIDFKFLKIFLLLLLLVKIDSFLIDEENIIAIKHKYTTNNDYKIKKNFGFINNDKRSLINTRGNEEYDIKGKKRKLGVSNKVITAHKKINDTIIQEKNKNNFFENSFNNNNNNNFEEFSEEELNSFLQELFEDMGD